MQGTKIKKLENSKLKLKNEGGKPVVSKMGVSGMVGGFSGSSRTAAVVAERGSCIAVLEKDGGGGKK